jgi:type I restriction enzyme S subunit
MTGEWETFLVAEAPLEIIDGDRGVNYPKQEDFAPSGACLFLNTGNVTTTGFNFSDRSFITKEKDAALRKGKLKRHDIVLTTRGTVGNVAIFDDSVPFEELRINSGMVLLRADQSKLLPRFLFQFVRSQLFKEQVAALTTGSAQPQLPIRDIRRVEVPLPPLSEQRAIAAVLGALDDKIELNRRMNGTLESMARALFQSWFVDFDPVRAKLDGRQPAGLDPETAALFPDSLEDSLIGPVPKGWAVQRLPDTIEVNPRRLLKRGTIAPYLDMKNLPTQGHSATEVNNREFSSGTKFQNGDTLLARITPCLENGKTGYVDFLEDNQVGWGSTEFIVLSPKSPLPPQFGYLLARSDALRSHAIQNMSGTSGRQRVPSECFNTFWLAVPPSDIARRFNELTLPMMAKIKANANQSRTLATLRDALLPKLLSGELSVAGAESLMENA